MIERNLGLQELDSEKDGLVKAITDFYELPPVFVQRGRTTQIFIVSTNTHRELTRRLLKEKVDYLAEHGISLKESRIRREGPRNPVDAFILGAFIHRRSGSRSILLLSPDNPTEWRITLEHELLHSLSSRTFGGPIGILPSLLEKFQNPEPVLLRVARDLANEAITDVLRLARAHPNASLTEIDKLTTNEFVRVYWANHFENVKGLARAYFNNDREFLHS